ncbi:MAG: UDP-glucuronic acid decarboxylase family protein [Candidatus Aenigmatarchaeota archaeon]
MKVLVTGGGGFLGSHVCERLLKDGNEVFCIDNLSSGNFENIRHLQGASFHFMKDDVLELKEFPKADFIFHMASLASPDYYQKEPVRTIEINTVGTKLLLEHAKKNGAGFFFTSTSEVYGDTQVIPTPETYWGNVNPNGIRSCYDEGKRCGEAYCKAYERLHGMDVRIVRIFNTYGPRLRAREGSSYGRVIPRFIDQALAGEPLTIFGDGSQTRSFTYVDDTIEGLFRIAFDKGARNGFFNIGNENETTIRELAEKIIGLTGSKSEIAYSPLPEDDPKRRKPDITKARSILGWEPKTGLDEGLKKTIEWYANYISKA